jgi:hypothetical protein
MEMLYQESIGKRARNRTCAMLRREKSASIPRFSGITYAPLKRDMVEADFFCGIKSQEVQLSENGKNPLPL